MAHKLDEDLLVTETTETRLGDEANFNMAGEDRRYWRCLIRNNGAPETRGAGFTPPVEYQVLAIDLLKAVNHEIAHDGAWIGAWTDWREPTPLEVLEGKSGYPERLILLWLDHGGDIQFTFEIEDRFANIVEAGIMHWVDQCEESWRQWHHKMRVVLDPSPDQLYYRAQGEKPRLH